MMILSCINKKSGEQKKNIVLTNMHDKVKVTNDQKPKTQILVMYDHTKGRMGVVDLISFHHSTRIRSKLWPLNAQVFMKYHLKLCQNLLEDKVSFKNFELMY